MSPAGAPATSSRFRVGRLQKTIDNPPGSRQLGIALSTNDYLALIVGGVLLAVAWVMVEATRIADEHASFV